MNYIHKLKFNTILNEDGREITQEFITDLLAKFVIKTIVHIGTIKKAATYDEEGNELTPEITIEGWHVDVLAKEIIEELREYCLDHLPNHCQHGNDFGDTVDEAGNIIKAKVVLKVGEVQL